VHQIGSGAAGHHLQIDAHGAQGRVGVGEPGRVAICEHARFGARRTEAVHPDIGQRTQLRGQVLHVDPGTAVDLRRIFAGHQVDAHGPDLTGPETPGPVEARAK
jgi:hypothetical protein